MVKSIDLRYAEAQRLLNGFSEKTIVRNDSVFTYWIEGTNVFWYEKDTFIGEIPGKQYRLVNAETGKNDLAFDHNALASALSLVSGMDVDGKSLPISEVSILLKPLQVKFAAFGKSWQFTLHSADCLELDLIPLKPDESPSPDKRYVAFIRDYNIWLRDAESGSERAFTEDGTAEFWYGGSTAWGQPVGDLFPHILWSPNSEFLLVARRDKRLVKTLPMIEYVPKDGSTRPILKKTKVAYPGDDHIETFSLVTINVSCGSQNEMDYEPVPANSNDGHGFMGKIAWWGNDDQNVYFIDQQRGDSTLRVVKLDALTGKTEILFEESSSTYVNLVPDCCSTPMHRTLKQTSELIWWSERSGWGHLYLYDLNTGRLKNQITSGNWLVRDVLSVDEERREVIIQVSSRAKFSDPYYREVCRVNIDSGEITTICSNDNDTVVHYPESLPAIVRSWAKCSCEMASGTSPCNNYIVVTKTRIDSPPRTVLLDRDGNIISELETADTSSLPSNWKWPEPVSVKASDNKTDLFGAIFFPLGYSPDKSYPVINYIGSGPWLSVVPKGSFHSARPYTDLHYFHAAALAALGFIVILLDSCGTPLRGKSFQEVSYGWIPSAANTSDHAGAIEQLASQYPSIDLNRVGIFCNAYRSGIQNFLERQDLYKVCVQTQLLDNRMIGSAIEGDKYEGIDGPPRGSKYPEELVSNLRGKLLLMHPLNSIRERAYPPAATFRVVDALQKANKDFDMLVASGNNTTYQSYAQRRAWDYLVTHLSGETPPKEFELTATYM